MIQTRLPAAVADRLTALVAGADPVDDAATGGQSLLEEDEAASSLLAVIRSAPGNVSLNTMLSEIAKLQAVRAVGLPGRLFADVAPKVIAGWWRARAAVESPSHLRQHPPAVGLTLLAALLFCREREITDTLVELLISTVHRINARAEIRVTKELIKEFEAGHGQGEPAVPGRGGDRGRR